jgi:hypothetical protein
VDEDHRRDAQDAIHRAEEGGLAVHAGGGGVQPGPDEKPGVGDCVRGPKGAKIGKYGRKSQVKGGKTEKKKAAETNRPSKKGDYGKKGRGASEFFTNLLIIIKDIFLALIL